MSYKKVVPLWASDNEETHGGENNGGARRVFCPRNNKYSELKGLSDWTNRRAFGFFHSGVGGDPARGGSVAGQVNSVDYITGMPDLRSEALHAIDCGGYDKLRIVWAAECLDYEGLAIDWANVPDSTDNAWADGVYALAYGVEHLEDGLDFVNFPPGLWCNANDPLSGEGVGSNLSGATILTNSALTAGTSWTGANGMVVGGSNTAVYTHNASGGTLTQTSGNFAAAVTASKTYILQYQITASTVAGGDLTLSGVCATVTGLPRTVGTHTRQFTTSASPGNFVLTATSSSGGFTMDNVFMVFDLTAGSGRRPRPFFGSPNNGLFAESELFRANGALSIRGAVFGSGGSGVADLSRYSLSRIPNGLPIVGQQVAWGALQWGYTKKQSGIPYGHVPSAGDRYRVALDIGTPSATTSGTATPAAGQDAAPHHLSISGLERVYFAMASVGVGFSGSPGLTPEYLVSTPVGGATAPRQHIKGRLYAILSTNSGQPNK